MSPTLRRILAISPAAVCGATRASFICGPWGAVISGDFFGWNYGLAAGGFGGMFAALLVMTVMYLGLCFSIAEMSPALPHAGGAYSFARTAMGPWGGFITGLAENVEYILTPAVIVVGVGGYLSAIFGTPAAWEPLWWLICYAIFVALNIWGWRCRSTSLWPSRSPRSRCWPSSGWGGAPFRPCALGRALLSGRRQSGRRGARGASVRAMAVLGNRAAAACSRGKPRTPNRTCRVESSMAC